jgi:cytoskeletal protein CcmA (bactofilin family)
MSWLKKFDDEMSAPPQTPAQRVPHVSGSDTHREMGGNRVMDKLVNIGKSIQIKGELTGNEDLTIEGRVDGKIYLRDHNLTVGANGHITAEIHAKSVIVVGDVVGNITADDRVEVASTGSMQGDICAPRVVLADGARFKGSIDMEPKPAAARVAAAAAVASAMGKTAVAAAATPADVARSAAAPKDRPASA